MTLMLIMMNGDIIKSGWEKIKQKDYNNET